MSDTIAHARVTANRLSYDADYVTGGLNTRAEAELHESEDTRVQSLRQLRSMLKEDDNLHWQDEDNFLLSFLRAKKFDVRRAFNLIRGMYRTFGRHKDIYYNFDFENLKTIMESNCLDFLPQRDKDDSVVVIFRFSPWDTDVVSVEEHLVSGTIGVFNALRSPPTQIAGFKLIFDFKGLSLKQLCHIKPSDIWFLTEILQNSVPIRVQSIHVINQNYLFSYVFVIFKQFLSKKLRERVHIHGGNMKSLHKFIDRSILPADCKGEQPPFDNSDWRERIEKSADYIKHVLSFGYEKYLKKSRSSII